jgi:hypothetical protein
MTEEASNSGHNTPLRLRGNNRAIFGRQLQGAEAPGASEEDLGISPGKFIAYSASRSKLCILLHITHRTFQSMWVTILQLLLLRQANLRCLGNSLHLHHQCNEASNQKGASTLISSETSERSPKLAQSTTLCQSRSTSTRRYPTLATVLAFVFIFSFE